MTMTPERAEAVERLLAFLDAGDDLGDWAVRIRSAEDPVPVVRAMIADVVNTVHRVYVALVHAGLIPTEGDA